MSQVVTPLTIEHVEEIERLVAAVKQAEWVPEPHAPDYVQLTNFEQVEKFHRTAAETMDALCSTVRELYRRLSEDRNRLRKEACQYLDGLRSLRGEYPMKAAQYDCAIAALTDFMQKLLESAPPSPQAEEPEK